MNGFLIPPDMSELFSSITVKTGLRRGRLLSTTFTYKNYVFNSPLYRIVRTVNNNANYGNLNI